jgi:acetoin:2,6-dichlorophenolindophenol oxidoreductase subunit alpha
MSEEFQQRRWMFLKQMMLIRRFEEAVAVAGAEKAFPGHYHLYIGQEATGVGAMAALGSGDKIATTHRNHGHVLARGADPEACFAEIMGRASGINRGRGGTIHLCEPELGFLQTSGVVGSVVGLAAGGGYACKLKGDGSLTAAFFGDGALEEGIAFECLNIAALWALPVIFICENNSADALGMAKGGYPTLVHAANDLRSIPGSLGIEAIRIDGTDAEEVFRAVTHAAAHCRAGKGPLFIETMTRRWAGSAPLWPELATGITDIGMATGRTDIGDGSHAAWYRQHDPLLNLARQILEEERSARLQIELMDEQTRAYMKAVVERVLQSPFPEVTTAADFVFAKGAA